MKKIKMESGVIQKVYETIPEKERTKIISQKKGVMNSSGNLIRMQCYIPKEVYVILSHYQAFQASQSDFFTGLACGFIERRAIEVGLMGVMQQGGR